MKPLYLKIRDSVIGINNPSLPGSGIEVFSAYLCIYHLMKYNLELYLQGGVDSDTSNVLVPMGAVFKLPEDGEIVINVEKQH